MAVAATLHKAARAAASVVTGKPPEQRRADAQQKLSRLRAQRVEIDANWKAKLHEDPDADVSAFEQSGRAVDREIVRALEVERDAQRRVDAHAAAEAAQREADRLVGVEAAHKEAHQAAADADAAVAVLKEALTRLRVAKATLHQAVNSSELAGVLADHTFAVPAVIDDALGASGHSFKRLGMPIEQSLEKRLPDRAYVMSLARRK